MQIGYSLTTSILTSLRFQRISRWEQIARRNTPHRTQRGGGRKLGTQWWQRLLDASNSHPTGVVVVGADVSNANGGTASTEPTATYVPPGSRQKVARLVALACARCLSGCASVWNQFCGGLDARSYGTLRTLLLMRIAMDPTVSEELRAINMAVASEQV
jgi:hypothetical protein